MRNINVQEAIAHMSEGKIVITEECVISYYRINYKNKIEVAFLQEGDRPLSSEDIVNPHNPFQEDYNSDIESFIHYHQDDFFYVAKENDLQKLYDSFRR